MHYNRLSVLYVLSAVAHRIATPLSPHWDDIQIKHAWPAVPTNWEIIGPPPPGTMIGLCVKPRRENALIEALQGIRSMSSLPASLLRTNILMYGAAP